MERYKQETNRADGLSVTIEQATRQRYDTFDSSKVIGRDEIILIRDHATKNRLANIRIGYSLGQATPEGYRAHLYDPQTGHQTLRIWMRQTNTPDKVLFVSELSHPNTGEIVTRIDTFCPGHVLAESVNAIPILNLAEAVDLCPMNEASLVGLIGSLSAPNRPDRPRPLN